MAYIPYTARKPLSRVTDKLSLVWPAVRNEENIAVFLSLIVCRCILDPLLCHVGKWRYSRILLGAENWSAAEGICHLVNGIKCHPTAALLASAVLSCPSGKAYTGFCWWNLRERDHLGDRGLDVKIIVWWTYR